MSFIIKDRGRDVFIKSYSETFEKRKINRKFVTTKQAEDAEVFKDFINAEQARGKRQLLEFEVVPFDSALIRRIEELKASILGKK
jgi:hypothetical protein